MYIVMLEQEKEELAEVKETVDIVAEPETETKKKKDEDDDTTWVGGCVVLLLIGVVVWALVHFNPSEEDHMDAIEEQVTEAVADAWLNGETLTPGAAAALSRIEYHSLGVCSWTTTRYKGKTSITSIGILGWTHPMVTGL